MPDVLKYFYEEPVLLEPVTPDRDPDARNRRNRSADRSDGLMPLDALLDTQEAFRGYLAGTRLPNEASTSPSEAASARRVGLTVLPSDAFVPPLLDAFGRAWWGRAASPAFEAPDASVETLDAADVEAVFRAPADTSVLVTADAPVDAERIAAAAGTARRPALPALRALLDVAAVVFFPEPAHDGHDWSFFSTRPLRERFVNALRRHPVDGVRRFACPYQKARSESKFYFETWQLTEPTLPPYIEEV